MKFTIPIIPKAQMRARHGRTKTGFSVTYKAEAQRRAEDNLCAALLPYRPEKPLTGAQWLGLRAYLPIPQSWPKSKKAQAQSGAIRPTSKPDLSNLIKHVEDCLEALNFWENDSQVVEYLPGIGKYYDDGNGPRWEIEIKQTEEGRADASTQNG